MKELNEEALLIDPADRRYHLGVESMDSTHQEFMDLVNRLGTADDERFGALFRLLLEHTEAHFAAENRLMEEVKFPPIRIHMGEHQKVLEEMRRVGEKVAAGSLAAGRSYVREHLPYWFREHAATMDSALAGCVKTFKQEVS